MGTFEFYPCPECYRKLNYFTIRCGIANLINRETDRPQKVGGIWIYYYCDCGVQIMMDWADQTLVNGWGSLSDEITMEELSHVETENNRKKVY